MTTIYDIRNAFPGDVVVVYYMYSIVAYVVLEVDRGMNYAVRLITDRGYFVTL